MAAESYNAGSTRKSRGLRTGTSTRRAAASSSALASLIAFNVNLVGANVEGGADDRTRDSRRDGGFPGVRALGLELPQAGHARGMNGRTGEASALHEIVAAIGAGAAARGAEVAGAELVGLMPAGATAAAAGAALRIDGFDASRLLELRLLDS